MTLTHICLWQICVNVMKIVNFDKMNTSILVILKQVFQNHDQVKKNILIIYVLCYSIIRLNQMKYEDTYT